MGNILEALEFLKENRFISEALCSKIKADKDAVDILSRSSRYIEPTLEIEVVMPEFDSDDEMMQGIENRSFNDEKTPGITKAYFDNKPPQSGKPNAGQESVTPPVDGSRRPGSPS